MQTVLQFLSTPLGEWLWKGVVILSIIGGAHLIQAKAPRGSLIYMLADKVLSMGPNFYQFFGWHPNPPLPYPMAPIILPPPPSKGFIHLRASVLLALGAFSVGVLLNGCKHMTPLETNLVSCGENALADGISAAIPQVQNALGQSSGAASSAALDSIALQAGIPAAICAIEAVATQLEGTNAAPAVLNAAVPPGYQLIRARAWIEGCSWSRGYRVVPK